MKFTATDTLNIIVGLLTIGTSITGMISPLFAMLVGALIVSWFAYYRTPWAHRTWNTENIKESVQAFYSFSKLLHAFIVYTLAVLITSTLSVGLITKAAPAALATDTADYVWNNKSLKSPGISSTTIPQELANSKVEAQPFAVVIDSKSLKAIPMQESLAAITDRYSITFAQFVAVVFLFCLVAAIGLYPMEMLANGRAESSQ